ncbi:MULTISPECIES: DUF2938 domain-containing protein [unclassified Acidovorax]|uniref:DUF2938 domain-containing protein n=1 Tax=unclassified Acidovorax TaxID=2684926 RepID=UPI0025BB0841|nr:MULTISPECIES: DUF2938 domain-containing protein [unclassified Acidovorax]HQS22637.1 DUF2938 domain-containing protein [Acidovorax defluvii]HQS64796.1 DUF2938 domain-containing protein [Acidovorax defluvii]HQT19354.1 DUF2938 domain-containing protein [Acidovorax defluvii]HQT51392.1 DUF2938 domain-containing protein [Acidovorax defluvii]
MTLPLQDIPLAMLIGIGATAVMDAWLVLLKSLGVPTLNFAFIGRWVGHLFQGQFAHVAIAKSAPIRGELAWGWFTHYAVGMVFATLLVGIQGVDWLHSPTLLPAMALGICTMAAPLLVMQPAMGAGFAASRTPTPLKNCLRSLANHTVFGIGLYLSALAIALVSR